MDIALFDFDGTVTHTDTFTAFMFFVATKNQARLGRAALLPTIIGYKLKYLPANKVREKVYRFVFKGTNERQMQLKGEAFARALIPTFIKDQALQRIKWHQQRGDRVVIVSATLDLYLKPWCLEHGLDLICTEVEAVDGLLTGRYAHGDCSGVLKKTKVQARYQLRDFDTIWAYGDTLEDQELLSLADKCFYQYF